MKYFNESFNFYSFRYEEWQGGRCISHDSIDTIISFIAPMCYANYVYFVIDRKYSLNIDGEIYFLPEHTSRLIDGRIQYCNKPTISPSKPIVCHLLFKNGILNCIRFAMTNPDRIIEFYGKEYDGPIWQRVAQRKFTDEEKDCVKQAMVVEGEYGPTGEFILKNGNRCFIQLTSDSTLKIGDSIDLNKVSLFTYRKDGEEDMVKIRC